MSEDLYAEQFSEDLKENLAKKQAEKGTIENARQEELNTDWIKRVPVGDFAAIPIDLDFGTSVELAHLVDGYALCGGVSEAARVNGAPSALLIIGSGKPESQTVRCSDLSIVTAARLPIDYRQRPSS